jgi:recombination protein RecT
VIGAYCTVKTSDGSYLTEEMNIDELNKIRNASKAQNGPWKNWPEEMMRKSVVKRASKYWPKVDRLSQAVDVINQHEGIDFQEEKDVTPVNELSACIDESQMAELLPMIVSAGMTEAEFCSHRKIQERSVSMFPAARFEGCKKWLKSITVEASE